ncbi:MAG: prepilin peptidase [bacterium]|nr:prepilin peptidase [bacterium]
MILLLLFSFLLGACVGSFLNVVILRLPLDLSIWRQPSHCMSCGTPIKAYDNIPILSYFILRGRCRHCHASFSPQYPIVEAFSALFFSLSFWYRCTPIGAAIDTGSLPHWPLLHSCLTLWLADVSLVSLLLAITLIDARYLIIPLELTASGFLFGAVLTFLNPQLHSVSSHWLALAEIGKALLAGAGLFLIVRTAAGWIFKREALGMGDVHLMAMLATYLNWPAILLVIFFSALLGSLGGLITKLVTRHAHWRFEIPYGPYLAAAALLAHFAGTPIIRWYLSLSGF